MVSKEFIVDDFPKGYYMSWFVATQMENTGTITLFDENYTYFKAEKKNKSTDIEPPLAIGADFIKGNNLKLKIDIPASSNIKGVPNLNNISSDNGRIVGHSFLLSIEDWTDEDYNDVYVALTCWKNKG